MFGEKEDQVQRVVALLQSRAEAVGMRAALDEAHDILREAERRVGHGRVEGACVGSAYMTTDPVAVLP